MKNKIYLVFLLLISAFFVACEDDTDEFTGPYRINVAGKTSVKPESEAKYTIGDFKNSESYTWTVEGPAKIVGSATGDTVTVQFEKIGDVVVSVSNGTDKGMIKVKVAKVEPAVTAKLRGTGVLKGGDKDTVFFNFASPLAKTPEFVMTTDSTGFNAGNPFTSGTLGELVKVSDSKYYALYTAGTGNGTPEARLREIIATATYGSDTVDTAYVQLYKVDNIKPIAELNYSKRAVKKGDVVTITATFSEPVMFATPKTDSALYVTLKIPGPNGTVINVKDTLEATSDPLAYTFDYKITSESNGTIEVGFANIMDPAGHEIANTTGTTDLKLDNTKPEISVSSATDNGGYATLSVLASEAGTVHYLVLGATEKAPETVDAFLSATGKASGSFSTSGNKNVSLAKGDYTVYYLVKDVAGNYSDIASTSLTMN